jgi:hypothetical protein
VVRADPGNVGLATIWLAARREGETSTPPRAGASRSTPRPSSTCSTPWAGCT